MPDKMADISLIQGDSLDDSDEGVFEQGDAPVGDVEIRRHIDDESLPPLLRVQKYAQSDNIHDRQMVWRILMDLFRSTPADSMTTYLPLIMNVVSKLADEAETMVRTDLLEQIPNLAVVARECSSRVAALKTIVSEHLLPMVVRNLGTEDNLVRKTAQSALFSLMEHGLVSRREAEDQVCPVVIKLSKEECLTDSHNGAVTLMSKMAPLLGREITERVFLERFSQICSNNTFNVRKVCASHFGDFCAVVGIEAYEEVLLPRYIALCSDDIWGVRKACAEVAMSVSCACPPAARRKALAPVFAKLLQDTSRWVRMSAFQTLGPFISTFAVPSSTNLFYNSMGELVMVNTDGREFRVNSSSTMNRSIFPLEHFSKDDEYLSELFSEIEEDNVVMNPLSIIGEDPTDLEYKGGTDEVILDIPNTVNDQCPLNVDSEKKREEVILQKNFNVVSKAMFGEVILDNSINHSENLDVIVAKEDPGDIKEIVETVKNAVLIFRNDSNIEVLPGDEQFNKCDVKPDIQSTHCDNFASGDYRSLNNETNELSNNENQDLSTVCERTTDHDRSEASCKSSDKTGDTNNFTGNIISKCEETVTQQNLVKDADCLELYNSYNYWYVSPEMPVDLSIIDGDKSPKKNSNLNCKSETLDELFSTFVIDESTPNSPRTNKSFNVTKVDEKELLEQQWKQDDIQHIVPKFLIDHFVSMTDPSLAQNTDNEMAYHCAYSLPAVALTLGSKNWHLLKGTVECLASDMQYKVRRTLASSLHELALILGPEIATDNLTPIFDGFIKDLDEVRIGVLRHLAHFLRLISPSKRAVYLPRLPDFLKMDNELNWRFRQELAEQLLLAVPLFRPADAAKHIAYIAQALLCDKVAAVRQTALSLITELLRHISNKQGMTSRLLIMLAERFAHSKKWKRRQTFALLCSSLITSAVQAEQFASDIMPHLLDLSWDPVANVRLVVARTISKNIITNQYFADPNNQHYDSLQTVLRRLQADRDRDVRHSAVIDNFTNPIH